MQELLQALRLLDTEIASLLDTILQDNGFNPNGTSSEAALSTTIASQAVAIPLPIPNSIIGSMLVGSTTTADASACSYDISTTRIPLTTTITVPVVTVTATYSNTATPLVTADDTAGLDAENSSTMTSVDAFSTTAATPLPGAADSLPISEDKSARYVFNAQSSKNVAVYFGQTPATGKTTLAAQCSDPNIDIVILAFVISQLDGGSYPSVNFGAACGGQTTKMAAVAPGLLSCPGLASNIQTCQKTYGKKVLLSIGGSTSQISFSSATQAKNFGDVLWNVFGPPGNVDIELRPFGTVSIDGFDVGPLSPLPLHLASHH